MPKGKLNLRQATFAKRYASGTVSASKAARDAGYSEKTGGRHAYRLLKNATVQKAIATKRRQELDKSTSALRKADKLIAAVGNEAADDRERLEHALLLLKYHVEKRKELGVDADSDRVAMARLGRLLLKSRARAALLRGMRYALRFPDAAQYLVDSHQQVTHNLPTDANEAE